MALPSVGKPYTFYESSSVDPITATIESDDKWNASGMRLYIMDMCESY